MKALNQFAALAIGAFRCLMQLRTQQPVGEHLSGRNAQPRRLCRLKKRSRGRSKVRAKYQGGRRAMRGERMDKPTGYPAGVEIVHHPRLFR